MGNQYNTPQPPQLDKISVYYDVSNPKCLDPSVIFNNPDLASLTTEAQSTAYFQSKMGVDIGYDISHLGSTIHNLDSEHIEYKLTKGRRLGLHDLSGNNRALALHPETFNYVSGSVLGTGETVICPIEGNWYYEPLDMYQDHWHDQTPFENHYNPYFADFNEFEEIEWLNRFAPQARTNGISGKRGDYFSWLWRPRSYAETNSPDHNVRWRRGMFWLHDKDHMKDQYGLVNGRPVTAYFAQVTFGYSDYSGTSAGSLDKRTRGANNWRIVVNDEIVAHRSNKDTSPPGIKGQIKPGDIIPIEGKGNWEIGPPILVKFDSNLRVGSTQSDPTMQSGYTLHPIRPRPDAPGSITAHHQVTGNILPWPMPKYTPGQFRVPDEGLIPSYPGAIKIENVPCVATYPGNLSGSNTLNSFSSTPAQIAAEETAMTHSGCVILKEKLYSDDPHTAGDAYAYPNIWENRRQFFLDSDVQSAAGVDFSDTTKTYHVFAYNSDRRLAFYEIVNPGNGVDGTQLKTRQFELTLYINRTDDPATERTNLNITDVGYTFIIYEDSGETTDLSKFYPPVKYSKNNVPGFIQLNRASFGSIGLNSEWDPSVGDGKGILAKFDDSKQPFVGKALNTPYTYEFSQLHKFSIFTWVRASSFIDKHYVHKDGGKKYTGSSTNTPERLFFNNPIVSAGVQRFELVFNHLGQLQFHFFQEPAVGQSLQQEDTTGFYPNMVTITSNERVCWGNQDWVFVGVTYDRNSSNPASTTADTTIKLFVNGEVVKSAFNTAGAGQQAWPVIGGQHYGAYDNNDGQGQPFGDDYLPSRLVLGHTSHTGLDRSLPLVNQGNHDCSLMNPAVGDYSYSGAHSPPYFSSKYGELHMSKFYMWHDTVITPDEAKSLFNSTSSTFGLSPQTLYSSFPGGNISGVAGNDFVSPGVNNDVPIYTKITNVVSNYDEDTAPRVVAEALEDANAGAGVKVLAVVNERRFIEQLDKISTVQNLAGVGTSLSTSPYGTGWIDSHFADNIDLGTTYGFDDDDLDGKKYLGIVGFADGEYLGVTFLIFNDQSGSSMDDPTNVIDLINHNEMTGNTATLGYNRSFQIEGFTYDVNPGSGYSLGSPHIVKTTTSSPTNQSWVLSTNPQLNAGADVATNRPNYYNQQATKDVLSRDDGVWGWKAGVNLQGNHTSVPTNFAGYGLEGGYGVANWNNGDTSTAVQAYWGDDNIKSSFRFYIFT
jgi:hypothetical protein